MGADHVLTDPSGRAKRIERLHAAARQRHDAAEERTKLALRSLESAGTPVTFTAVAAAAQVSRSWLYKTPTMRWQIDALRDVGRATRVPVPTRQRSGTTSLVRRLEAAHTRNQHLEREVAELREQLAVAHADLRAARRGQPSGDR